MREAKVLRRQRAGIKYLLRGLNRDQLIEVTRLCGDLHRVSAEDLSHSIDRKDS